LLATLPEASSIRPTQKHAAGSVSRAYGHEHHQISLVEAALLDSVAQTQGDRARGGISVAVDIDHYFAVFDAQPFLHGANNAQIGLMGHDQGEVVAFKS